MTHSDNALATRFLDVIEHDIAPLNPHKSNVLSERPCEEQNALRLSPPRSNCETNSRHSLAVRRR